MARRRPIAGGEDIQIRQVPNLVRPARHEDVVPDDLDPVRLVDHLLELLAHPRRRGLPRPVPLDRVDLDDQPVELSRTDVPLDPLAPLGHRTRLAIPARGRDHDQGKQYRHEWKRSASHPGHPCLISPPRSLLEYVSFNVDIARTIASDGAVMVPRRPRRRFGVTPSWRRERVPRTTKAPGGPSRPTGRLASNFRPHRHQRD